MTSTQRRRKRRRERRHHYRVRLLVFTVMLLFGALACLYVDAQCKASITTTPDYVIKYDWEYEQELKESMQ